MWLNCCHSNSKNSNLRRKTQLQNEKLFIINTLSRTATRSSVQLNSKQQKNQINLMHKKQVPTSFVTAFFSLSLSLCFCTQTDIGFSTHFNHLHFKVFSSSSDVFFFGLFNSKEEKNVRVSEWVLAHFLYIYFVWFQFVTIISYVTSR